MYAKLNVILWIVILYIKFYWISENLLIKCDEYVD